MVASPSVVAGGAMTATITKVVTIIVTLTARRPGRYEARLDDGTVLVTASRQPFLDAARKLISRSRPSRGIDDAVAGI